MSDEERRLALTMLRGVLAQVETGGLTADSAQARRLLRRLEGALIALRAQATAGGYDDEST